MNLENKVLLQIGKILMLEISTDTITHNPEAAPKDQYWQEMFFEWIDKEQFYNNNPPMRQSKRGQ